jgi:hypothetical protein
MLWAYFFGKLPNESDLVFIDGKIERVKISKGRTGYKAFYLQGLPNRFEDGYLSMRRFERLIREGDLVRIRITKEDMFQINSSKRIKIWSLDLNNQTIYTANQEINHQRFYQNNVLPLFGLGCLVLAMFIYKLQLNDYKKKSAHHFS